LAHAASHAAQGSDPVILSQLDSQPSGGVNKFKLGLGGDSPTGRFVGVSTAVDPLIGIFSYQSAEDYDAASEVGSSRFGMTLGANDTNLFAQYLQDGGLEATYNFPATGGVVAVLENEASGRPSLDISQLTEARSVAFPDADGTIVLDSQLATVATSNSYDDLDDLPTLGTAAVEDTTAFAASGSITSSGLTQATARILGRTTASTGAVEEITVGSGLSLSAGELSATSTFDPASPAALGTTTPNTGAFTSLTGAPAANTAAYAVTGYSLTGSNAQSVIDLAGTWNTTGTPSAIKLNITDTASNAASRLFQVSVGGTERFAIRKDGAAMLTGGSNATGGLETTSSYFRMGLSSGSTNWVLFGTNVYAVNSAMNVGGVGGGSINKAVFNDAVFEAEAATVIAQRSNLSAQESRLYGTWTSSTNFQRMTIKSVKQTLSALSGASATTTGTFIPDGAVVVGVTTRVGTALTGATGYTIGDGTDADRWGDITGTAIGTTSDNANWTAGTIECFTAGGNVTLTANGSNFTAGAIEICVFYLAGQAD
jgi:hypothetical protein